MVKQRNRESNRPTAEQIQEECLKIRRSWSEHVRRRRERGSRVSVQLPVYSARLLDEAEIEPADGGMQMIQ